MEYFRIVYLTHSYEVRSIIVPGTTELEAELHAMSEDPEYHQARVITELPSEEVQYVLP